MADHEDYLPGEAPMAHHESHESLGSDEIDVTGLHGALADDQPCLAHDLGGAKHIADSLADLNTKVSDATLEDKTVLETTMDTKVATHAALPTVHQDAPALIATHTALPAAHHAKYTDAEAMAVHNPLSLPPPVFVSFYETQDWIISEHTLRNRVTLAAQYFMAPVIFPNGVTVTKLTLYGYRDDAAASMILILRRVHRLGGSNDMASITADWTTGWSSKYDDTISLATINNNTHAYALVLTIYPNDHVEDVRFSGAKIEFTG